jgi:beta-N-acetylhexosaminidase
MRFPRLFVAWVVLAALCLAQSASRTKPSTPEEKEAYSILKAMPLEDRVAQMVIGVIYGDAYGKNSPDFKRYRHWIAEVHLGGLIVINMTENGAVTRPAEPHAMGVFLNQMQRLAKVPLLVGGDFERGASMRVRGGALFPFSMAFGAANNPDDAWYEGRATAREARAVGVHWVFAPVSDVNNNPENPIINIRSYSENPDQVSGMVAAFVQGAHSDPANRILVTAKHFPGHGDTNVNSHVGLPNLTASRQRMSEVELKPFRAAIDSGVDAVMTAHMTVPSYEVEDLPATVSPKILTGLLRQELNFKHLIVTDAMDMQGLTKNFDVQEAAVRSVAAGVDVLLMPPDPEGVVRAVVAAVKSGRLTKERIDESAMRILTAKVHLGLIKNRFIDLNAIADGIGTPEDNQRAAQISERAVTLVKNEGDIVPLMTRTKSCMVLTLERRTSGIGQRVMQEFQKRMPEGKTVVLDASLPRDAMVAAMGDYTRCQSIVIVSSISPTTRGKSLLPEGDMARFVKEMTDSKVPTVLISLGSPYLLGAFPNVSAYLATFSTTEPSELAAVRALFGEIPISGRLPVSIPGYAKFGDGIQLSVRPR